MLACRLLSDNLLPILTGRGAEYVPSERRGGERRCEGQVENEKAAKHAGWALVERVPKRVSQTAVFCHIFTGRETLAILAR